MKKRALCTLGLSVLMLFALVGCVDTPTEPVTEPTTTTTTTTVPTTTTTTTTAPTIKGDIDGNGTVDEVAERIKELFI